MSAGTLLIPVENQVRELDPKLLLATVAAHRGFSCILGSRQEVDFRLGSVPRGIYLAKSMTKRSRKVFSILRQLGHEIVVWDEEALVTYSDPEIYYGRRLDEQTMGLVSHHFAWGEANAELLRKFRHYPGTPIHVTGNPRGDLLRPELRSYYEREAAVLREEHGDFLLVNTNFGHVNAYNPIVNLLLAPDAEGKRAPGRGSIGMTYDYAAGRAVHKQVVFEAFGEMIPFLHDAFPQLKIVVRPHPVEDPTVYRELEARLPRVEVINDGQSPVPWLMATHALVHNCCTTGLESWIVGTPAVTYRPVQSDAYEESLPNKLSHDAFDLPQLREVLERIVSGRLGRLENDETDRVVAHHLAGLSGPLASERIADAMAPVVEAWRAQPRPRLRRRLEGRWRSLRRRIKKEIRSRKAGSKNSPEFQRHRYPGLSIAEVRERVDRFGSMLGLTNPIAVSRISAHVYRIEPGKASRRA
ncbi:MAG: hypothetical protein JRH10_08695 [Deltaproteobacteria bacterium]|nr:hypothetical protein [Deltaproteobacteria bacterium]MBW2446811.1 hypothetical protein [Deltaproteobacteria bacterium]